MVLAVRGQIAVKALLALVTVASIAMTIAWYGWLEPPFLSYRNLPFEPAVSEIRAGEPIPLRVTRCNSSGEEQSYLISHRLIRLDQPPQGQPAIILAPGIVDIDPGCIEEQSLANVIPKTTPPGVYFVRGRAKVEGRWRTSYVAWSSLPFRVLQ